MHKVYLKLHALMFFLVPCCNVLYDFLVKRCSVRVYSHLVCIVFMFNLLYTFIFESGVQHDVQIT